MPEIRSRYSPRVRVPFDFHQPSRTQQHFKDECAIDRILKKYSATGFLVDPLAPRRDPLFGDFSESISFMEAQTRIARVREAFDSLPSQIRDRFANDPYRLLAWCEDPDNAEEAVKLGLLPESALPKADPAPAEPAKPVEVDKTAKVE
ncbi:internal scaffolding protein [Chicken microvirus mg7_16]|nr:internal scaffolding protein [Chicken microvirus mg7_16]